MDLTLNNDKYKLPDSWDDLSEGQLLRIADLANKSIPVNQFKTHILLSILGFQSGNRMYAYSHSQQSPTTTKDKELCYVLKDYKNKKRYLISITDLAYIVTNSLGFLFKESIIENKQHIEIDCKLNKTIITSIPLQGEKWFGPGDSLSNSTYEEYIRCLVSASEYSRGDSAGLDRLICAMYRPGNSENAAENGDFRQPFNDNLVQHRAKFVANLHPVLKSAIMLQFNGAIRNLANIFPNAFGSSSSNAKPPTSRDIFLQQFEIIDNLAQHRIPDKEIIRKSQLYDVLQTLDNVVRQNNELKRKLKKK
jgi:hypothetical protein